MTLTILFIVIIYYLNTNKAQQVSRPQQKEPTHEWPPVFGKNLVKSDVEAENKAQGEAKEIDNAALEDLESEESQQEDEDADSNQAKEDKIEEIPEDALNLPPKDGSLTFKGPQNARQRSVVEAFKHAWQGYRNYAWGKDHLKPISKTQQTWFDLGLTLIDSLDTMLVMGLTEEFAEARDWVETDLRLNTEKDVNLFETTIRVLGGLLSTFHLTKDNLFLEKATELADR